MLPPLLVEVFYLLCSSLNVGFWGQEQRVQEMELRVKQQSVEMEKGNELRQTVIQEKARLELHVASLSAELQEANKRYAG